MNGGVVSPRPPQGGGVYIYREGETNPSGNVFATFAGAYAAASRVEPATIAFDPSLDTDLVIPAGTYDLDMIPLVGAPGFLAPALSISSGVTFTGRSFSARNLTIESLGATAPWTVGSSGLTVWLEDAASITVGAGPAFSLSGGVGSLTIVIKDFLCFMLNAGAPVIQADAGETVTIFAVGAATTLYAGTGAGLGTFTAMNMLAGVTGDGAVVISPTAFP